MIPIIYPYKMGSQSATLLARALSTKKIRSDGMYRPRSNHLIVNWGNSTQPIWPLNASAVFGILNKISCIIKATNKLTSFEVLKKYNVSIPEFTTDFEVAANWVRDRIVVLARHSLTGHSGRGIEVVSQDVGDDSEMPEAPLYVKYIKKTTEYRVHVFRGQVIDIQQKKKQNGWRDNIHYSSTVRSHSNGWVFSREGVNAPNDVIQQSLAAVAALGLDFGAVDVIWNQVHNRAYVLEVNTAPGLEGHTVEVYANAIRGLL